MAYFTDGTFLVVYLNTILFLFNFTFAAVRLACIPASHRRDMTLDDGRDVVFRMSGVDATTFATSATANPG